MTPDTHIELISGYLEGSLSPEEQKRFEYLVQTGEISPSQIEELQSLSRWVSSLPAPEPQTDLKKRFLLMLEVEKKRQNQASQVSWYDRVREIVAKPFNRLASSLSIFREAVLVRKAFAPLLFLFGLMLGYSFTFNDPRDQKIQHLTSEIQDLREMIMISLLDNPSATQRLKAVNISLELSPVDRRISDALLTTLNHDPNVNVRLAAIDALMPHAHDAAVREAMVQSISHQKSPMVQLALADAMLILQEPMAVGELKKIIEKPDLDGFVRERLEQTITALL